MPNGRNSSASASALLDLYERSGSDELLELLIEVSENISEALVVYDGDGRLVFCNRNFRELYGYTEAEAHQGVHFRDLGKIDIERGNVAVGDEYGDGEAYLKRKAE
jgi:PAS domain-containing protein